MLYQTGYLATVEVRIHESTEGMYTVHGMYSCTLNEWPTVQGERGHRGGEQESGDAEGAEAAADRQNQSRSGDRYAGIGGRARDAR